MDEEVKSLIKVWLTVFASLLYCYFIASKIPRGKLRLLSLLPIFSLFTVLPLYISSILLTGITAFFLTWLAIFKLILFSFDLGPLASDAPMSFLRFASVACFPIRIKQCATYPAGENHKEDPNRPQEFDQPPKLPLNLPVKILLFAILIALNDYSKPLHPNVILCIYCTMLYLFVDILLGLSNAFVRSTLGIELERPSNEPYLATSLQDFWGRRWNLLVSNTLRYTVYRPVRSALGSVISPRWAPVPAVFAAFVVSGLMHELLYFYVTGANPTWEVTWFFVLHGVCMLVEFGLKSALGKRWRLHWAVSGPLTVAFVVATAAWLFFPPLLRNGTIAGVLWESSTAVEFVQAQFTSIVGRAQTFML